MLNADSTVFSLELKRLVSRNKLQVPLISSFTFLFYYFGIGFPLLITFYIMQFKEN
jgi:hypothetical protein